MHESATKKNYLSEQENKPTYAQNATSQVSPREIEGYTTGKISVMLPVITTPAQLDKFINYSGLQDNLATFVPGLQKPEEGKYDRNSIYAIIANLFREGLMAIAQTSKNTDGVCNWSDQQSKFIIDSSSKKLTPNELSSLNAKYNQIKIANLYSPFTKLVRNRINTIYDCQKKQTRA